MEHVRGHWGAELLRDEGHLDVDQAVDILAQACRGLDYAHRNGVVHRDVKPGNLLVSDAGIIKLADFGIARATDQSSITQVGSVLGTAAYLAPEQARGEEAGPRADIYSLGVVAYQLLSGRLPYEANSLSELALKQQRDVPPPLEELNPRVPRELGLAVAAALAIDQEERPADAVAFGEALRSGASGVNPFRTGATRLRPPAAFDGDSGEATRIVSGRRPADTAATRRGPAPEGPTDRTDRMAAAAPRARRLEPQPPAAPPPGYARREPEYPGRRREPYPERRRGSGRAIRRLIGLLALLCLVAAAVVVAVSIASSTSPEAVRIQHVVSRDANTAINELRKLIGDNTTKK
jgi:serine/threonine-protein kinase